VQEFLILTDKLVRNVTQDANSMLQA